MILTCPECASRYFVDDANIGPQGRKVRCASCGHAWREGGAAAAIAIDSSSFAPSFGAGFEPQFAPNFEPAAPEVAPVKLRTVRADVSSRIREEAVEKRKTREAAAVGATWAVLAAGFCALALMAVMFKTDVVRMLPATAGAYAFARMPVNPVGLAIDSVQGGPGLQDGRAALKISGLERNVETHPLDAAPLSVSLIDKAGHKILSQIARPPAGPIQPGETLPFSVSFFDPPMQAASFQVEFAFDAMKPSPRPIKAQAHPPIASQIVLGTPSGAPASSAQRNGSAAPPVLPLPAARDAQPLPASSPYALPSSATTTHG